jgi:redox-sensitive bicupin YhaK (pirin superfamily)
VTGWHHFCFAGYQRSDRMSWGALRGLSQYDMEPAADLPATFHAGFEVVTIVLAGRWKRTGDLPGAVPLGVNETELVSTGVGAALGGIAAAGIGASIVEARVATHRPDREARRQSLARRRTDLARPIATGAPPESDALLWAASARLHYGWLQPADRFRSRLEYAELGYLLVVDGAVSVNNIIAQAGDGVTAAGPGRLELQALERARVVWIRGL